MYVNPPTKDVINRLICSMVIAAWKNKLKYSMFCEDSIFFILPEFAAHIR